MMSQSLALIWVAIRMRQADDAADKGLVKGWKPGGILLLPRAGIMGSLRMLPPVALPATSMVGPVGYKGLATTTNLGHSNITPFRMP